MGIRIAAFGLWAALFLQFVPALLWAEDTNFRSVPSPLVRQVTQGAQALVAAGFGLGGHGVHRLSLAGQISR